MSIRFRCKNCNQKYELDDDCSGATLDCDRCKNPMVVPPESEIPPSTKKETPAPSGEVPPTSAPEAKVQEIRIASSTAKNQATDDIVFRCNTCNQKYRLPRSTAGQIAECSICNKEMVIPTPPDNAPASAASKENVTLWCKSCGQRLCLPKELAGQEGECTKCKKVFIIPAESEAKLSGMLSRLRQEVSEKRDAPAKIIPKPAAPVSGSPAPVTPKAAPAKPPEPEAEKTETKTAINSIKYVLEIPERTYFFISFSLLIDKLMQTKLLHRMSRKLIIFLFIITTLLMTLITYCGMEIYQRKAKNELHVNVMCANCNLCQSRVIKNIATAKCSKCKGPIGFQWKCNTCGKIFTRIERISEDNPIQCDKIDTLTPPVCPYCNSAAVKYNSN